MCHFVPEIRSIRWQDQRAREFDSHSLTEDRYTTEWESKGVGVTTEGDFVVGWRKDTGKNTSPAVQAFEGEVHYMTLIAERREVQNRGFCGPD